VGDVDQTLAALADPTRRAMIGVLRQGPRRSSEIADALALSRPATSRHLGVLRRAALVSEQSPEDDARVRIYALRPEPFTELRGWVEEVEAFWGEQLQAFKDYAEGEG
jgi:DNA-binding transcriptional ArsR family regulator